MKAIRKKDRTNFVVRFAKYEKGTAGTMVSLGLVSWIVVAAMSLASCQKSMIEPVAIAPEDMCAYCRMAISEKQYAAELIDGEGEVFKFDDIGCMAKFVKDRKDATGNVSYFVMDFSERQWIKAKDAEYVRSPELNTPMHGGIIAFNDQAKAKEAADRYHGQRIGFANLFSERMKEP